MYVVCDGMGGSGTRAKSPALWQLPRVIAATHRTLRRAIPTNPEAEQAVAAAVRPSTRSRKRNQKLSGMGTTLVSLLVENSHAWILNVGDSRGYRLRSSSPNSHIVAGRSPLDLFRWLRSRYVLAK